MTDLVVVQGELAASAGIIAWWELTGFVDLEDLREVWAAESLDPALLPEPPTLVNALHRAALHCLESKRQLIRPLTKRGQWELIQEVVVARPEDGQESTLETTRHTALVQGFVRKEGDRQSPVVRALDPDAGERLRGRILAALPTFQSVLTPSDISAWLLDLLVSERFQAVGLRQRGGFYFIPAGPAMDTWGAVTRALRQVSKHTVSTIPAMRTEEAVEAILQSLRREAIASMEETEVYLAGEVSTRGLNSAVRSAELVQRKLDHYAALLGVELTDLGQRAEQLKGAVMSARLTLEASAL